MIEGRILLFYPVILVQHQIYLKYVQIQQIQFNNSIE